MNQSDAILKDKKKPKPLQHIQSDDVIFGCLGLAKLEMHVRKRIMDSVSDLMNHLMKTTVVEQHLGLLNIIKKTLINNLSVRNFV